jgi:hypothetical protein
MWCPTAGDTVGQAQQNKVSQSPACARSGSGSRSDGLAHSRFGGRWLASLQKKKRTGMPLVFVDPLLSGYGYVLQKKTQTRNLNFMVKVFSYNNLYHRVLG